jgi:LPS sulfotransferase NodH
MANLLSPIFIVGNPRSGTSLLRLALNSHPLICIPPESHFFLWLESKFNSWNLKEGFDIYLTDLYNSTKFETWKINKNELLKFLIKNSPKNYSELNALVYKFYSLKNGSDNSYWGDKNKLWKEKLYRTKHYYPNAKFIHIYRDGRDIACSYREVNQKKIKSRYAPKLPNKIEDIALKWKQNIKFISQFLNTLESDNFYEVSYEKLVQDNTKVLSNICNFLNVKYPNKGLSHLELSDNFFDEPIEFLQWKGKTKKPLDIKNIGKYNKNMPSWEIDIFNEICEQELKLYEYL